MTDIGEMHCILDGDQSRDRGKGYLVFIRCRILLIVSFGIRYLLRHVWVKSALMLIQIHGSANQKGYVILHNRSLYCRLWVCLLWRDFFFCFSIAYFHYNRKQFISKFAIDHVSCRYKIFSTIKEFIYDI